MGIKSVWCEVRRLQTKSFLLQEIRYVAISDKILCDVQRTKKRTPSVANTHSISEFPFQCASAMDFDQIGRR